MVRGLDSPLYALGLFYQEYFFESERDVQQGSMIVTKFRAEFTQLERFAPGICVTEAEKAKRFKKGLHLVILYSITCNYVSNLILNC